MPKASADAVLVAAAILLKDRLPDSMSEWDARNKSLREDMTNAVLLAKELNDLQSEVDYDGVKKARDKEQTRMKADLEANLEKFRKRVKAEGRPDPFKNKKIKL